MGQDVPSIEANHELDLFAQAAAAAMEAPVGLVTVVDLNGQSLPGAAGLPEPWMSERWTPLSHSFCKHVVATGDALVVVNAHDDPRVRGNLAIVELGVIAYAGVPVHDTDDVIVGALCAIDHKPRRWTDQQIAHLNHLAHGIRLPPSTRSGSTRTPD